MSFLPLLGMTSFLGTCIDSQMIRPSHQNHAGSVNRRVRRAGQIPCCRQVPLHSPLLSEPEPSKQVDTPSAQSDSGVSCPCPDRL
ncbi:hypothetical protein EDB82DRAFT_510839, partial [Fusarium venenatum]|uniref:uncharacterized protein n=1 Tax=Fusarium venenatum TaxID=56646 RepID=UPI001DB77C47